MTFTPEQMEVLGGTITIDDWPQIKPLFPGVSYDSVRRYQRQIKGGDIMARKKTIERRFVDFLGSSKTSDEIAQKFNGQTEKLLSGKYPGYNLFEQVNERNENVYILLPEIPKDVRVKPRRWTYHIGYSDENIRQPYQMVQLPKFKSKLLIAPIYDVHYGHVGHRHEKFLSYIRWIKETPNVYAFLGGDLMENALDDGRGMSYDQSTSPTNQLADMARLLAPIAHKVLFAIPGNHEERTYKKTGTDLMKFLADRLDIPYFDGPVFCSVLANGYKWLIHASHGYGNSQTKGGKMNSAGRPRKFTGFINFFVSGHVHDPVVNSESCIVENPVKCRLDFPQQWTVIAPSFLRWEGTYAYRAGYAPPGKGGVALELFANGDYRAGLI